MRKEWELKKTEKHALTVRIALLVMLDIFIYAGGIFCQSVDSA